MHVTYDARLCATELMQGDVLARNPALDELLKLVHPHYFQHQKNRYFMVLTQSCDLVLRDGAACKAPYITLAPVRSLDLVVERHLAHMPTAEVKSELPVLGGKSKSKASEFLQRLFNNNEPGYFFLDSEDTPLESDSVAFLNLSIAIKADLHFQTCLQAKILQLDATFQAKLGWLVGQMYSRVGTLDWEPSELRKKVNRVLQEAAIWVDDGKLASLEAAFEAFAQANPGSPMPQTEISKAIAKVPSKKQLVLKEAARVIGETLGPDQAALAERLRKRLEGDAGIATLLK
jgi:hypothetical protein